MLSFRTFARSVPRAIPYASSSAAIARCQAAARTNSLLLKTCIAGASILRPQQTSAFSTTVLRRATESETDEELSAKLTSEIEFERDVKGEGEDLMRASVKDFLENSPFEIHDTPGKEEVQLTRTFGNEKITISFSISDIHDLRDGMYDEDPALGDEAEEMGRQSGETSAAEAEAEAEDDLDSPEEPSVPCRLNIVVEKPGKGALAIEAMAQDGEIVVENLYYYSDPKLAYAKSADASHAAQDVYPGPPFGTLDEDLQILMERYLEERGITQALALFVPDYMDMKEQKEYYAWLNNVKSFVEA